MGVYVELRMRKIPPAHDPVQYHPDKQKQQGRAV